MLWNLKGACAHNHFTSYVVVLWCVKNIWVQVRVCWVFPGSKFGVRFFETHKNISGILTIEILNIPNIFLFENKKIRSPPNPLNITSNLEPGQLWKNRTRTCLAYHYVTARARAPSIDIYLKSESRDGSHPPYIEVHYGELHISRPKPFLGSTKTQTWGISNQNNNKHQENNQIKFLKLFKLFYNP